MEGQDLPARADRRPHRREKDGRRCCYRRLDHVLRLPCRAPEGLVQRLHRAHWRELPPHGDPSDHGLGRRHLEAGRRRGRDVEVLCYLGRRLQMGRPGRHVHGHALRRPPRHVAAVVAGVRRLRRQHARLGRREHRPGRAHVGLRRRDRRRPELAGGAYVADGQREDQRKVQARRRHDEEPGPCHPRLVRPLRAKAGRVSEFPQQAQAGWRQLVW
mmetsp:Transcript_43321/g.126164  ORF Transcript_43321/g.126164 Transcript_43321/m.126164 type:complete len:215 (-) Transcript_43321:1001-1645(-)